MGTLLPITPHGFLAWHSMAALAPPGRPRWMHVSGTAQCRHGPDGEEKLDFVARIQQLPNEVNSFGS